MRMLIVDEKGPWVSLNESSYNRKFYAISVYCCGLYTIPPVLV